MPLIRRLLHSLCALALLSLPARAEPLIPGETTPEFRAAVDQWLAGDDLAALESLSLLSQSDNTAAQILLARIASNGYLHGHVTSLMARKDRVALLRQPGGLSGKSWLSVASQTVPLAQALQTSTQIGERAVSLGALLDAGETAVALRVLQSMVFQGKSADVLAFLDAQKEAPPAALPIYALASQRPETYTGSASLPQDRVYGWLFDTETIKPADVLAYTPIVPRDLVEDPDKRDLAIAYTASVPSFAPLVTLCQKYCPDSQQTCTAVAAGYISGPLPMPFASPSQRLVSDADYWASPRIEGDVLRRLSKLHQRRDVAAGIDACFADRIIPLQNKAQTSP